MSDSPAVLARVRDPRYAGWFPRDAPDVGTGEAGAPEGDTTRIQVRVDRETRRIAEAVFKVVGGAAAIASASLVAERLHGLHVSAVDALEGLAVVAELQLPLERAGAAARAVDAARNAVANWEGKQAR